MRSYTVGHTDATALSGFYLWLIAVGDYFEYTPLQVFHIGNAQSVQNRADGLKEKTLEHEQRAALVFICL